jgi:hypothetical protein
VALIVETGAGVAGADCYADVAACTAYATAFYGSPLSGTTADKEAAIRRATAYLNGLAWKGTRTLGRAQSLAWPRAGVTDCEGLSIGSNEIPTDLINAQHELARAEFQTPGSLTPSLSKATATVSSEKVDVIQITYDTDNLTGTIEDARLIVTAAMDKLKCYLSSPVGATRIVAVVV